MNSSAQNLFSPVGPQFIINESSDQLEGGSYVEMDEEGYFIVVWDSFNLDEQGTSSFARIFDENGTNPTDNIPINEFDTDDNFAPQIAISGETGNFVVIWESINDAGENTSLDVIMQIYSLFGDPLTDEIYVSNDHAGLQFTPQLVVDHETGNFVVVWEHISEVDGEYKSEIRMRIFDEVGDAITDETIVNEVDDANHFSPEVAMDDEGFFTVVWTTDTDEHFDVNYRRFNPNGEPLGPVRQTHEIKEGDQHNPHIAMNGFGDLVIAWTSTHTGDIDSFARFYDPEGEPLSDEFQINDSDLGKGVRVAYSDNEFAVFTWQSEVNGQDDIFAKIYDDTGEPISEEFQVPSDSSQREILPDVDIAPNGFQFVIVWDCIFDDGNSDVCGRVFRYSDLLGSPISNWSLF